MEVRDLMEEIEEKIAELVEVLDEYHSEDIAGHMDGWDYSFVRSPDYQGQTKDKTKMQ